MTRAQDIGQIRALLQRKRRDLLETALAARGEAEGLKAQDRDPEFEENAQVELADYTLSSLMETQRRELMQVDAALTRMDHGAFGECLDCGADIPYERLVALPFAVRCEECATEHEERTRLRTPMEAMPSL
ncbi:MAG TPA: TraR/DksA C4-type zinc finger protein [Myxococcales bacterium]|jgi:DnaK suppressor protein|nr:TraR/DksA C4-type zinc finger protein [Myxococcales bacterium]